MTTSTSLSGAVFSPKPPAKGSFPLDHLAECKQFAAAYETCLRKNNKMATHCRKEAKLYLECRMERGLMAKEGWDKLGLNEEKLGGKAHVEGAEEAVEDRAEARGFVAGARTAKRKKDRHRRDREQQSTGD